MIMKFKKEDLDTPKEIDRKLANKVADRTAEKSYKNLRGLRLKII